MIPGELSQLIAQSGAHGTGKTTAAHQAFVALKTQHPQKAIYLLADQEAFCPYPINKETSPEAQMWIFTNQIRRELDLLACFDIVVTDHTVVDIMAYTAAAGFESLVAAMWDVAAYHVSRYHSITFRLIRQNSFWYPDGIRESTDSAFRQKIEDQLLEFYGQIGFKGRFNYA